MSTMRNIKKKMAHIVVNPHRRRYLVKHSKIKSEIDPKQQAKKWAASKFSRKLINKKDIRTRLQKSLKKTESTFHDDQLRYAAVKKQEKKERNENRKTLKK